MLTLKMLTPLNIFPKPLLLLLKVCVVRGRCSPMWPSRACEADASIGVFHRFPSGPILAGHDDGFISIHDHDHGDALHARVKAFHLTTVMDLPRPIVTRAISCVQGRVGTRAVSAVEGEWRPMIRIMPWPSSRTSLPPTRLMAWLSVVRSMAAISISSWARRSKGHCCMTSTCSLMKSHPRESSNACA